MPRPSSNPDKAISGGGIEAGNYEVLAAKFQNIKTDRRPNQPNLVLRVATLDKNGDVVRGADEQEVFFPFGEKALDHFHPGKGKDRSDGDPEDMGDGVDAEGNTIYCEGSEQFNRSCGYLVFNETLVKWGFPKSVLDETFAPNYVGLKFSLETLPSKDVNDRFGTRLNTRPMPDGGTVTYKVATKWLNPNYLSTSNGAAGGAAKGKAKAEEKEQDQSAEEICAEVLAVVGAKRPGEKGKIKSKSALSGFFSQAFISEKKPSKMLAECKKLIADDDYLIGAIAELDGTYEEGVTTFPEV